MWLGFYEKSLWMTENYIFDCVFSLRLPQTWYNLSLYSIIQRIMLSEDITGDRPVSDPDLFGFGRRIVWWYFTFGAMLIMARPLWITQMPTHTVLYKWCSSSTYSSSSCFLYYYYDHYHYSTVCSISFIQC